MWFAPQRTPALYPDAVTLQASLDAAEVVPLIDSGPGSSIKDSFADLELGIRRRPDAKR